MAWRFRLCAHWATSYLCQLKIFEVNRSTCVGGRTHYPHSILRIFGDLFCLLEPNFHNLLQSYKQGDADTVVKSEIKGVCRQMPTQTENQNAIRLSCLKIFKKNAVDIICKPVKLIINTAARKVLDCRETQQVLLFLVYGFFMLKKQMKNRKELLNSFQIMQCHDF